MSGISKHWLVTSVRKSWVMHPAGHASSTWHHVVVCFMLTPLPKGMVYSEWNTQDTYTCKWHRYVEDKTMFACRDVCAVWVRLDCVWLRHVSNECWRANACTYVCSQQSGCRTSQCWEKVIDKRSSDRARSWDQYSCRPFDQNALVFFRAKKSSHLCPDEDQSILVKTSARISAHF